MCEINESKIWREGPTFLKNQESTWPEKLPNSKVSDGPEKCIKTYLTITSTDDKQSLVIDPNRFSSFAFLVKVVGYSCGNLSITVERKKRRTNLIIMYNKHVSYHHFKMDSSNTIVKLVDKNCFIHSVLNLKTNVLSKIRKDREGGGGGGYSQTGQHSYGMQKYYPCWRKHPYI